MSVIRYVVTTSTEDPQYRKLFHPQQGRYTYETPEQAQAWIDGFYQNNSPDVVAELGQDLQVRPCLCYPGHFDPFQCYFKESQHG